MIDTHAHLYDPHFLSDLPNHLQAIQAAGVEEVWLPNCDAETWKDLLALWEQYPRLVRAMCGLHPTYVKENYQEELALVKKVLESRPGLLAVGEIGLDYYWDISFKEQQMQAFLQQCRWALEYGLWVDIHCRKAYADMIQVLKRAEFKDLRGVVHCFSGDASEAKHCVDQGFYLGIGGVLTYKNAKLFEAIQDIPLQAIVLETDSPYLSPVPHRGQPNSPAYLPLIAEKLAEHHQMPLEDLLAICKQNSLDLLALSGLKQAT